MGKFWFINALNFEGLLWEFEIVELQPVQRLRAEIQPVHQNPFTCQPNATIWLHSSTTNEALGLKVRKIIIHYGNSNLESMDTIPCIDGSYSNSKTPRCETLLFYVQKLLRNYRIHQKKKCCLLNCKNSGCLTSILNLFWRPARISRYHSYSKCLCRGKDTGKWCT